MRFTRGEFPILVIIGPSGAGKSTAIKRLADEGLVRVNPSWTTRPARKDETGRNVEHRFVSEEEFARKEKDGFFLETVVLFGLPYRYGLPALSEPGADAATLVMLRAPLIPLLRKYYPEHIIYQIEDDLDRIKSRLAQRQENGESLGSRLSDYEKEVEQGRKFAVRVFVNRGIEQLVRQLRSAVKEDFKL